MSVISLTRRGPKKLELEYKNSTKNAPIFYLARFIKCTTQQGGKIALAALPTRLHRVGFDAKLRLAIARKKSRTSTTFATTT